MLLLLPDKMTPGNPTADWTDTILLRKPGSCKPLFCGAFSPQASIKLLTWDLGPKSRRSTLRFLSARACNEVGLPRRNGNRPGNDSQHFIAGGMTVGVVVSLEVIDVDAQ